MEIRKRNWDEITINDYRRIVDISNRELDSDMEKDIAVLAVMCDCDERDMYNLPVYELQTLLNEMGWIKEEFTFDRNFKARKIKINGVNYDVQPDIDKFTVAQYMDFQNFWNRRKDNRYIGNLLAVFIVPEGHKYNDGYDVMELAQTLENTLSIKFYNEVCFFFIKNWMSSIKASIIYSDWNLRKTIRRTKDKEKRKELLRMKEEMERKFREMTAIGL